MDQRRLLHLLGWPLASLTLAVAVGVPVGAAGTRLLDARGIGDLSTDEAAIEGLPPAIVLHAVLDAFGVMAAIGVATGLVVGLLIWATGLVAGAQRLFPPRHRTLPVALTVGAGVVLAAVALVVLGAVAGAGTSLALALVVVVTALALASIVFPAYGLRAPLPADAHELHAEMHPDERRDPLAGWGTREPSA